eukprot:TRINITY_DN3669_c0_g1_i18.p1 TRINITY_DN3669_c0_g1~~TRINITY_DN3669_c0_g1_i18.p1  ORF type:complete len:423 (+),score=56.02 TRINITY_DN3669_c0_g1_i18:236-1504(+)
MTRTTIFFLLIIYQQLYAQYYPINDPSKLPQNQEQTTNDITALEQDSGLCQCNLNAEGCDFFCCCDPDCSATQVNAWTKGGQCIIVVNARTKCMRKKDLIYVNTHRGMTLTTTSDQICVEVDQENLDIATRTYIPVLEDADANKLLVKTGRYQAGFQSQSLSSKYKSASAATTYTPQTPLYLSGNAGFFSLPSKGFVGTCQDSFVQFTTDVSENCIREANLQQLCAADTILDGNYYIKNKAILVTPGSTASISPQVVNVYRVSGTSYMTTGTTGSTNIPAPSLAISGDTCTCSNVLAFQFFYISYDSQQLRSIQASVGLYDTISGPCASAVRIPTYTSADFTAQATTQEEPIQLGYDRGDKLIAGTMGGATVSSIRADRRGYYFQGVDKSGTCTLSATKSELSPLLDRVSELYNGSCHRHSR